MCECVMHIYTEMMKMVEWLNGVCVQMFLFDFYLQFFLFKWSYPYFFNSIDSKQIKSKKCSFTKSEPQFINLLMKLYYGQHKFIIEIYTRLDELIYKTNAKQMKKEKHAMVQMQN